MLHRFRDIAFDVSNVAIFGYPYYYYYYYYHSYSIYRTHKFQQA